MKPFPYIAAIIAGGFLPAACAAIPQPAAPFEVRGDAIHKSLTGAKGDAERGREMIIAATDANCLFCHSIPETGERFMGNVAPPLSGVAGRLSEGQIRLRVVDPARVKSDIAMPSYHRVHALERVASAYNGKPILTAQQVEDVIAYLLTLR